MLVKSNNKMSSVLVDATVRSVMASLSVGTFAEGMWKCMSSAFQLLPPKKLCMTILLLHVVLQSLVYPQ